MGEDGSETAPRLRDPQLPKLSAPVSGPSLHCDALCPITADFSLTWDTNLFTFDILLSEFLLSTLINIAPSGWPTYFCCRAGLAFNDSNYRALITGVVPRMLGFSLMFLLRR